ncbi:MAG: hypothetical protein NTV68_16555, partial [Methanomicrobiales archaeon]|nr:hypothetical protein [Methanomicrobiales archaeon]
MMSVERGKTEVFQLRWKNCRMDLRGKLIVAGLLLIALMLFVSAGSAGNRTDLSSPNNTTSVPGQVLSHNNTPVPAVQNTTIVPTAHTQNTTMVPTAHNTTIVPTTRTQNTTMVPTVQNTTIVPTSKTQNITTIPTTHILRAGSALNDQFNIRAGKRVSQDEKEAAAERFKALYWTTRYNTADTPKGPLSVSGMDPGGIPHYFGPYPNYANSPMPTGSITTFTLDNGGNGYSAHPVVIISDVYGTGSGATATVNVTAGIVTDVTLRNGGTGFSAPIVTIIDTTGSGAVVTASIGGPLTGGIRKFVDTLPGLNVAGANNLGNYIPIAVPDTTTYPPGGIGYSSTPQVIINDPTGSGATAMATVAGGTVTGVTVVNPGSGYSANPVISFSGGGATTSAIGKATVTGGAITGITLVGCDYYVIELGEFYQKMHSDLPTTKFRGYRQVNT